MQFIMLDMVWYNSLLTADGPEQNHIDFLNIIKEKA